MAEEAEAKKAEGNTLLGVKDYEGAVRCYTEAIALDGSNHVYYSNRSGAHLGNKALAEAVKDAGPPPPSPPPLP